MASPRDRPDAIQVVSFRGTGSPPGPWRQPAVRSYPVHVLTRITLHYRLNGGSGRTSVADALQRESRDVPEALLQGPRATLLGYLHKALQESHGPAYTTTVVKVEWGLKAARRWAVPEELWPSPTPPARVAPLPSPDDGVQLPRW